jgi:hypothetical protein
MSAAWPPDMKWSVRVDMKKRTVELHSAGSLHWFDATDVIHHYQRHGNVLALRVQVVVRDDEVELQPLPWREQRTLTQLVGERLMRGPFSISPPIVRSSTRPKGH